MDKTKTNPPAWEEDRLMQSVILFAKERNAPMVCNQLSLHEKPEIAIMLNGSMGETDEDIDFILKNADNVTKMVIFNGLSDGSLSHNLNDSSLQSFIRDCVSVYFEIPVWSNDKNKNKLDISPPFIRGAIDSYYGIVKLIHFLEQTFDKDEEFKRLVDNVMESSNFGIYGKYPPYINLIQEIAIKKNNFNPSLSKKSWERREAMMSQNGSEIFIESNYERHSFIMVFEALIQAQKNIVEIGGSDSIERIIKDRIKAYAKTLITQLGKGVNDSLLFFGNRNLKSSTNPIGQNITSFSECVIGHSFSSEFKADLIGKIIVATLNGNTKNMHHSTHRKLLELANPIVNWEVVVDGLSHRGKQFLIENSKAPWLFEPYLDKNSRAMLLRGNLSL